MNIWRQIYRSILGHHERADIASTERLLEGLGKAQKGFTLIELLVVIAILGLLAAIAIPNVAQFIGRGETEARQTEHHNIQVAVLALMADAGVGELDDDYYGVKDTPGTPLTGVDLVKATVNGTEYTLDSYLMVGKYPLLQAYNISIDGEVTVP